MAVGRTIGIDLGASRCGVAIDDELGQLAHPRPTLSGRDRVALVRELVTLARAEGVRRFVLGLPLEMSGEEGRAAARARSFAEALADASGLPVVLRDERLTTVEAASSLRRAGHDARSGKALIDAAAAVTILQSWLDTRKKPSTPSDEEES